MASSNFPLPALRLVRPSLEHLDSYCVALRSGWSPETLRAAAAQEELERIADDPAAFLAAQTDLHGSKPPVVLQDGTRLPRLPGFRLWMWDGEFCGSIGLRWQPGTPALPEHCLGHIGYSVVPQKRRRGYAKRALALMLPFAREQGLPYAELTTDPANLGSRRVIEGNGGVLVERFYKPAYYGDTEGLRYRIAL